MNCTIGTAWDFFSSPHNLSAITPKDMGFTVLSDHADQAIYQGMEIDYLVSPLLKIPLKWKTRITQVSPYSSFTDLQEKGPYRYWSHFHEFIPNENGVLMKDTVAYEMPLGVLGSLAHRMYVKRKLSHIFDYRQVVLEQLFNSRQ